MRFIMYSEYTIKTYNIKLVNNLTDACPQIINTLDLHNKVWNLTSDYIFSFLKKHDRIPTDKIIHDNVYRDARNKHKELPAQFVIKAMRSCRASFLSIKSNSCLDKLEGSPIKKRLSARLDKRLYRFSGNGIHITFIGGRTKFVIKTYDKINKLMNTYEMCDPSIFVKDDTLYLSIPFRIPNKRFVNNSCIGIDLGIKRFVTTSDGTAYVDKKFLKEKRRLRYLKRILNSKKKSSSARKKLKRIRHKERNKTNNFCHHVANKVLKTESNTIVMEDLSKIKKKNRGKKFNNKISQVPFYKFKQIISYKAALCGKRVVCVKPHYTSKRDYRSSHNKKVKDGVRRGCRYIASDGIVFDADWNAAINIAKRFAKHTGLPVSYSVPLDGSLLILNEQILDGQGAVNRPIVKS